MAEEAQFPEIELQRRLVEGSHATLYQAFARGKNCIVRCAATGANADFLKREVALARMSSPALPAVWKVDVANGVAYSVSEGLDWPMLADRIAHLGALEFRLWGELVFQLGEAVLALYRHGLEHGELCARNVLIDESQREFRLVNFHSLAPRERGIRSATRLAEVSGLARLLFEALVGRAFSPRVQAPCEAERRPALEVLLPLCEPDAALTRLPSLPEFVSELITVVRRAEPSLARSPLDLDIRERELAILAAAVSEPERGVIVLRGASGAGKTFLVDNLAQRRQAAGQIVLRACCEVWNPAPFRVIRQLLESFLDAPGTSAKERRAQLTRATREFASLISVLSPRMAKVFPDAGPVPRSQDAEHIYAEGLSVCLTRLLEAETRPLLVLEDSQWLDEASRKVLKRLVERSSASSLKLLLTMRDDRDSQIDGSRLLQSARPILSLALAPLDASQMETLVSRFLGRMPLPPQALEALMHLSDGTPLSTLEMVRLVLDAGLLRPNWSEWKLHASGVSQLQLPSGTLQLLARRSAGLSDRASDILLALSVLGNESSVRMLTAVADLDEPNVWAALGEAERAQLAESTSDADWRLVHGAVREALLAAADTARLQRLHRRAAVAFRAAATQRRLVSAEDVMALAHHSALGGEAAALVYDSNFVAGVRAFERFDNTRALVFFAHAEAAAGEGSRGEHDGLPLGFYQAESLLRQGELSRSLAYLHSAFNEATSPVVRALLLSREAWISEIRADTRGAESLLARAFVELGERPPQADWTTPAAALGRLMARPRWGAGPMLDADARRRAQVLSAMHYHSSRLAFNYHKPSLLLARSLCSLKAAEALGCSPELAKAFGIFSILLTAVGARSRATCYAAAATQIADELDDPVVRAHACQLAFVCACHRGDMDQALALGERCVGEYSSWMELNELCLIVWTLQQIESTRGRGHHAWSWSRRGIEKALVYEGAPAISSCFVLSAEAVVLHLGLAEAAALDLAKLRAMSVEPQPGSGWYLSHLGFRLRTAIERDVFGTEFEAVVSEFESGGHDPKKVYIVVTEYYLHLAHARVHQAVRADATSARQRIERAERALADLKIAARVPLLKAHVAAIEGALQVMLGNEERAETFLSRADELGRQQTAPWVLYAVARARAHQFLRHGNQGAAKDQARIAQALAHEHGAVQRQRWIEEEFELPALAIVRPRADEAERADGKNVAKSTRHLRALVNLSKRDSRDLDPKVQARRVLDEMLGALFADRGFLWMREWGTGPLTGPVSLKDFRFIAGRDAAKRDTSDTEHFHSPEFTAVLQTKSAKVLTKLRGPLKDCSVMVTPLLIQDQVVGAACLMSFPNNGYFTQDDAEVFSALAGQIPMALQLARAIRDRDRLTEDLRHAQKMDAVGRLAGGISHDFNNMLSAIRVSADAVLSDPHRIAPVREELTTISGAADRATRLTRQLLTFSRRQVIELRAVDLNGSVRELLPMVRKLVGPDIEVLEDLDPALSAVWGDATQLEQAIVNLVLNAKDAMPDGGRVVISSSNELFEGAANSGQVSAEYAMITVADNGVGMTEEIRQRVFEPFFTTKGREEGTGLGLAMVYGIVRQCGGIIDVKSAVNLGTTVRICLPRTTMPLRTTPPEPVPLETLRGAEKILLVEDERLVRQALARVLRQLGYHVLTAVSGAEALAVAAREEGLRLVITDVIMPGMNGVELVKRLGECGYRQKVLYISGYTDGVLLGPGAVNAQVEFMQKPIPQKAFAERVRQILDSSRALPINAE